MLTLDDGEPPETIHSPCPLSVTPTLDRQRGERVMALHPGIRTPAPGTHVRSPTVGGLDDGEGVEPLDRPHLQGEVVLTRHACGFRWFRQMPSGCRWVLAALAW
jgi:hypothetical protein